MTPYNNLSVKIFGGSHEKNIGVEIEGIPVGTKIDLEKLRAFTDRRKSGKYAFSTPRKEADEAIFESGIDSENTVTGKIRAVIENTDIRPSDYGYSVTPRPSHADYVSVKKYGQAFSGGGAFSGRMTAPMCIAGGIAKQILAKNGIQVLAYISEMAGIECYTYNNGIPNADIISACHDSRFPVIGEDKLGILQESLTEFARRGDTVGGIIECIVFNPPIGLGGPLEDNLEGRLASALFSIPAVKAVESGLGRDVARLGGLKANDPFEIRDGRVVTSTNNAGGINGGISNGMPITLRVSFRPTPSVAAPQRTVNLETMENVTLEIKGRHDIAFLPRAVPVVESQVALVILDSLLDDKITGNI